MGAVTATVVLTTVQDRPMGKASRKTWRNRIFVLLSLPNNEMKKAYFSRFNPKKFAEQIFKLNNERLKELR